MRMVTLLEICVHWGGCMMEHKCAGNVKHCQGWDVLEIEDTMELGIGDCTHVGEVSTEMMGITYGHTDYDDSLDLTKILLGFCLEVPQPSDCKRWLPLRGAWSLGQVRSAGCVSCFL